MTSNALVKHALAFLRRGHRVIPLAIGSKIPLASFVPHGAHDASVDPETICRWWSLSPSANIGVTLEGLIIIDRDDRNDGDVTLLSLEARFGTLPRTWRTLTAGGEHVWLALPPGASIRGGNNRLGPGLDVKTGPGAYVVAPPSLHPLGIRYQWRSDSHPAETPLALAPGWIVKLLTPPPPPAPHAFILSTDDDQRIGKALARIPSDDRETWLRIGMALRSHYGDAGRQIWDEWSATSAKFDEKAQARVWRSFRGNGVTIATVFHLARGGARAA